MNDLLVVMDGIDKQFPGVQALRQARFELRAGEVHALVGENGAGKSTLMKVLAGVYKKDAGRILYKGREVEVENPRKAQELGISIIHQELNLMPHLTVAQNIFIGREPRKSLRFFLDERALNEQTRRLLDSMHLRLDPRGRVGDLTVAKQQMVEIAKALSYESEVLVMDEPTSALSEAEIEELFRIIRQLRDKGVGIVYISHRLQELKQISDRITVMRDGEYIGTLPTKEASLDTVISMMVGRKLEQAAQVQGTGESAPTVLEVRNLNCGRVIRNVSFKLKKGEILGFAGLMGAGRTEVARAIFGADPVDSGEILVMGKPVHIKSPADAVKHGIGYLSEDRRRYGLTLGLDLETNVVLASFEKFLGALGWVRTARVRDETQRRVDELQIKTPSLRQKVKFLSGGNQQKVVIAKWLARDCDILIFDEPTRGIDVGAKSEIHQLLNELAASGKSIMMISSELPEILRMSHRIIVMCEGRITGELSADQATEERIMQLATDRGAAPRVAVSLAAAETGVS